MQKVVWGAPSFWIERFPLYWGIEQGFFAKQSIDLEIWYSYGGPELARAVNAGSIHIGEMGLPPFVTAYREGLAARIIGSSVIQQLDHYLAARLDIDSVDGLAGGRIGILSAGSCDDYFIRKILTTHDIDPERDVELMPLGEDYGKLDLFIDGRVDAAFVVEPQLARGEEDGLVRVIDRVADYYPRYQWGIILASNAWLQHQGDLLARLMHAFRQACRSIKDRPGQTIDLGSRVFGVAPGVFEHALQRDLSRWEIDARLDMAGLQSALKVQEAMGLLPADISLDEMVCQL
ncbi:MAG: ABC transporter substrate-binding protein [bacterium]|nr:ABC transporter substrate-binding protein [bacterium]